MNRTSRYRRAVHAAMNDTSVEDLVERLRALDFDYAALCRIAEGRGWNVAVSYVLGSHSVHLFTRHVGRFSFQDRDWLIRPHGAQVAGAPVETTFDEAARVVWATVAQQEAPHA